VRLQEQLTEALVDALMSSFLLPSSGGEYREESTGSHPSLARHLKRFSPATQYGTMAPPCSLLSKWLGYCSVHTQPQTSARPLYLSLGAWLFVLDHSLLPPLAGTRLICKSHHTLLFSEMLPGSPLPSGCNQSPNPTTGA
jgi:hypothetical protein